MPCSAQEKQSLTLHGRDQTAGSLDEVELAVTDERRCPMKQKQ